MIRKSLMLALSLMLCFALAACGGGGGDKDADATTVGDISFHSPDSYKIKVNESGNAEYYDDKFFIGIYIATDESAQGYEQYDPTPSNVEELYDCFVNKNKDVTKKKKIKIDGNEADSLTYGKKGLDIVFLYKGKLYSAMAWNDDELTDDQKDAYIELTDSIKLK